MSASRRSGGGSAGWTVLLPTLGSAGDVHPVIGLAKALGGRGHHPVVVTSPRFREVCEREGVDFEDIAPGTSFDEAARDPDVWDPWKGFGVLARHVIVPSMGPLYGRIQQMQLDHERLALVASSLCLGARLAHEALGVPLVSLHVQPVVLRSRSDRTGTPHHTFPRRAPRWVKNLVYWIADKRVVDSAVGDALNEFRRELGLEILSRPFDRWVHSPQCIVGLWPEWYAPRQPDWPAPVHLTDFPLFDPESARPPSPDAQLERFLEQGEPPVLFTAGSGNLHGRGFFAAAVESAERLGLRGLLVSPEREVVPERLPETVRASGYVPFDRLMPRCRAVVHHGGIGTTARAIAARRPQVVVPSSHDQPDNAARVRALGLGEVIPTGKLTAARLAAALQTALKGDRAPSGGPTTRGEGIPRAAEIVDRFLRGRGENGD